MYPESLCGFCAGWGSVDVIFFFFFLQPNEYKRRLMNRTRVCTCFFVDMTKAFDMVNHKDLWKLPHKFGCPEKMIAVIHSVHGGMMARMMERGDSSEAFPVTNGTKQG